MLTDMYDVAIGRLNKKSFNIELTAGVTLNAAVFS
jgi:hypothetical protein